GLFYLHFISYENVVDAKTGETCQQDVVEDVYEVKKSGRYLKLRRAHQSRWQTLSTITPRTLCRESGGSWVVNPTAPAGTPAECDCPGPTQDYPLAPQFIPGAGGCLEVENTDEDSCDNSGGGWTDDDATLIGTFCTCPLGQALTTTGCNPI